MPALVKVFYRDLYGNALFYPEIQEVYIAGVESPNEVTIEMLADALEVEMRWLGIPICPMNIFWVASEFRPN